MVATALLVDVSTEEGNVHMSRADKVRMAMAVLTQLSLGMSGSASVRAGVADQAPPARGGEERSTLRSAADI